MTLPQPRCQQPSRSPPLASPRHGPSLIALCACAKLAMRFNLSLLRLLPAPPGQIHNGSLTLAPPSPTLHLLLRVPSKQRPQCGMNTSVWLGYCLIL